MPENTWKGILNSIREKTGKADLMTSGEVANEIANITTGFPNGTKWTQSNLTSTDANVYYSNGFWYCSSYNGIGLYYSLNGKEWIATNIKSGVCSGIEYNNGVWMGIRYLSSSSYYSIIRSIDGINWDIIGSYKDIKSPVYGKGLWVTSVRESSSSDNSHLAYSSDGLNWTPTLSGKFCGGLIYADGVWLTTLGETDTVYKSIYYSTDGKEWICSNIVDAAFNLYTGKGMFLAGGSGCTYHSLDGKEWSTVEIHFRDIICVNGTWFGYTDDLTYYSEDGIVWAETNIKKPLRGIYHSSNVWVATYEAGSYPNKEISVLYSADGKEWHHSNLQNKYYYGNRLRDSVINANGIWIMPMAYAKDSVVTNNFYSLDGKNWIQSDDRSGSVVYANGMWVSTYLQYSVAWEAKT